MKTGAEKRKTHPKSTKRRRNDASVALVFVGTDILNFQREVATRPTDFLKPLPTPTLNRVPKLDTGDIMPERKETQEKLLEQICDRVETLSNGKITPEIIQEGIQHRCLTRALSILHNTVFQEEEGQRKLKIIENAGTEFEKKEGGKGIHAGAICHAFLRQNGLHKKISHKEMALELQVAFQELFQKTRGSLEEEGFEINETQLKQFLAAELFRRVGGRTSKAFLITNAKQAAQSFASRAQQEKENYLALQQSTELTAAASKFVTEQISPELRQFILDHPLKPVFERNPKGGVLLHPQTQAPILNEELPEKWRRSHAASPVELLFQALPDGPAKEEIGGLLDTLRLPRKLNIPLQASLEELQEAYPQMPEILERSGAAEKNRLTYEISKAGHSLAYRLGLAIAASGEGLLEKPAQDALAHLQTQFEELVEKGTEAQQYWTNGLPQTIWEEVTALYEASKKALETSTKTPEIPETTPKVHSPNFERIH